MIITILVYPFGTTIGPIGYYHLGPPGNWTPMIEAFRDHNDRIITPDRLVGMVSFPSYHAAVGVLIICATWPLRVARWLFLPLNVGMLFTTIPYGEHYLVDVIGGVVVAIIALLAARRCYEKT
jgi:membrane-associated phospholipid phosphatase